MKPMLLLIFVGVFLLGIMMYIAFNRFEGVVEGKTFEAAAKYDETSQKRKKAEMAIEQIKYDRNGDRVDISITIDKSKTDFSKFDLSQVFISKPTAEPILLESDNATYYTSANLPGGWYNIMMILHSDDGDITITKSLYIN